MKEVQVPPHSQVPVWEFLSSFHIHLLFNHAAKTANKWSSHSHALYAIHPRSLCIGQTQLIHFIRPPNRSRVVEASGPC